MKFIRALSIEVATNQRETCDELSKRKAWRRENNSFTTRMQKRIWIISRLES